MDGAVDFEAASKSTRPLAIFFHRFGPYHVARLKAAARGLSLVAVEYSDVDLTYKWDRIAGENGFRRMTMFAGAPEELQSAARVLKMVHQTLDGIRPAAVAIPGWSNRCALAALDWCARHDCPSVLMSDSTAWDEPRKLWKEFIKKRVVRLFTSGFVAGRNHRDYLGRLGMGTDRVFLGYDVVDNDYFACAAQNARNCEEQMRCDFGLPRTYFLASARFVPKKNLSRLIEAYARYRTLVGNCSPWDLVLLGDGELRDVLRAQISRLRLEKYILMPGFVQYEQLPVYYGLAEAFVHASTAEQWGLVVNEAMATGLPVIVSNRCGCAADLVMDGVNGFTFDPDQVDELARLMRRISAPGFRISDFGVQSRHIAAQWGVRRFTAGLRAATDFALAHPLQRATVVDRLILRLLIHR